MQRVSSGTVGIWACSQGVEYGCLGKSLPPLPTLPYPPQFLCSGRHTISDRSKSIDVRRRCNTAVSTLPMECNITLRSHADMFPLDIPRCVSQRINVHHPEGTLLDLSQSSKLYFPHFTVVSSANTAFQNGILVFFFQGARALIHSSCSTTIPPRK